LTREPTTGAAVARRGNSRRAGFCGAAGNAIRCGESGWGTMADSQAVLGYCIRRQRWISGFRRMRRGWRDWLSADDEELLADVDTGAAHHSITAVRFCTPGTDIRFPDDCAVSREPVLEPEGTAFLPEFQMGLRHRLPGVEHPNEMV